MAEPVTVCRRPLALGSQPQAFGLRMGCGPVDLSSYHQTKIGGQNTESRAGKCLQQEARKLLVTGCTEDVDCEIRHYSMFVMLDNQCGIIFQFNCGLDFLFGLPNFLGGRF